MQKVATSQIRSRNRGGGEKSEKMFLCSRPLTVDGEKIKVCVNREVFEGKLIFL